MNINSGRIGLKTPVFGGSRLGDSDLQILTMDVGTAINFIDGTTPQQVNFAIFENNDVMTIRSLGGNKIGVLDFNGGNAASWLVEDAESTMAKTLNFTNGFGYVNDHGVQYYLSGATPVAQSYFNILIHSGGAPRQKYYMAYYDGTTYDELMRIDPATGKSLWAYDLEVPDEAYGIGWDGSNEVPTKNAIYDKIETLGGGGDLAWNSGSTNGYKHGWNRCGCR